MFKKLTSHLTFILIYVLLFMVILFRYFIYLIYLTATYNNCTYAKYIQNTVVGSLYPSYYISIYVYFFFLECKFLQFHYTSYGVEFCVWPMRFTTPKMSKKSIFKILSTIKYSNGGQLKWLFLWKMARLFSGHI